MNKSDGSLEACCLLCFSQNITTSYCGPIRTGGATSRSTVTLSVRKCQECGVEFLFPVPNSDSRYVPKDLNDEGFAQKIAEQHVWVTKIGISSFARKSLLDVGAGGGHFFDIVGKIAGDCYAVEIEPSCRLQLAEKVDVVCESVDEVPPSSIDVATAFDVLEHVRYPIELLKSVRRSLRKTGVCWIGVPNQRDILVEIEPAYLPFYYHDSHLWYFDERSLTHVAEMAGFRVDLFLGVHKYNFGNLLHWVAAKSPNGKSVSDDLSYVSASFGAALESARRSSHLLVRLVCAS